MFAVLPDLKAVGTYVQTLLMISQIFFCLGVLITASAGCFREVPAKYLAQGFLLYFLALLAPPVSLVLLVAAFKSQSSG